MFLRVRQPEKLAGREGGSQPYAESLQGLGLTERSGPCECVRGVSLSMRPLRTQSQLPEGLSV